MKDISKVFPKLPLWMIFGIRVKFRQLGLSLKLFSVPCPRYEDLLTYLINSALWKTYPKAIPNSLFGWSLELEPISGSSYCCSGELISMPCPCGWRSVDMFRQFCFTKDIGLYLKAVAKTPSPMIFGMGSKFGLLVLLPPFHSFAGQCLQTANNKILFSFLNRYLTVIPNVSSICT